MKDVTGERGTREVRDMNTKNNMRNEDKPAGGINKGMAEENPGIRGGKKMKKILILYSVLLLICFLTACTGPVQVARNESEGLKAGYQDPELAALSRKYDGLLKSIYARYRLSKMSLAKGGLGFTSLTDNSGRKLPYLMVEIRPEDVNFDKNTTTGDKRLQLMLQR
ncbi:MAG TPA: hypothetical protein VLX12_11390, partial [Syntrophorhabdales bacterium]|nr:hypothetical protein [Syntrophorhabdales bacterium]